jgi:hypothetical protein
MLVVGGHDFLAAPLQQYTAQTDHDRERPAKSRVKDYEKFTPLFNFERCVHRIAVADCQGHSLFISDGKVRLRCESANKHADRLLRYWHL